MNNRRSVEIFPLQGFPLIRPGDDLGALIIDALSKNDAVLSSGDVIVIAQKVISKAEGRFAQLASIKPSERALAVAADCEKDPRLVELILQESDRIVKCVPGVLIVRHILGFVMANAGIDQSNVGRGEGDSEGDSEVDDGDVALLLPKDPDVSARVLKQYIDSKLGVHIGVVINDSFGRPFRQGTAGVCIGSAGVTSLDVKTGSTDLFGRELLHTEVAVGDEIAAAASLVMGQADEATPVVVIRGLDFASTSDSAQTLVRPVEKDLFVDDES